MSGLALERTRAGSYDQSVPYRTVLSTARRFLVVRIAVVASANNRVARFRKPTAYEKLLFAVDRALLSVPHQLLNGAVRRSDEDIDDSDAAI